MTTSTAPSITGDTVLSRLAALQTMPIAELKAQWRSLFGTEPPPFNRAYIVSRLSYRVQELEYGGLKPETLARLEALGDELEREDSEGKRPRYPDRPIAGTRLVREYRGIQHTVTVTASGFEWQGRPYQSLSAIARAVTGTRWNGRVFFGLKSHRGTA